MESAHFHRRHDHLERFFAGCTHRFAQHFHVREHFNHALIETEIANAAGNLSIFDEKSAVASHSGKNLFVRIHFADIPKAVTRMPRSVERTISSTLALPPVKTKFIGASPYSFGSEKPWPVGCFFIFFAVARE